MHVLAAAVASVALVRVASVPVEDPDAPWHVLLGSQIWNGVPPWQAGHGWTIAPVDDQTWVSTQWLAELLLAGARSALGWNGLLLLRVALAAVLLAALAVTLLPGRPARAAVPVFVIVASPVLIGSVQERPQSISYLLLVPLSGWAVAILRRSETPRVWLVLPLTLVWANTHGLWVLLPAVLTLAALSRWLDHGLSDRAAARTLGLAVAALTCGLVSPAGLGTLTAAWRFKKAAVDITEWQPVNVLSVDAALLISMAVIFVLAWSRGVERPARSELLFVGTILTLALTAYRNIPSALILVAPFAVERITAAWHPQRSLTSPRERRWLATTIISLVTVGLVAAMVVASLRSPFLGSAPIGLAEGLAGSPEAARVLTEYNESGLILDLTQPRSRTAIDGRADLFGAAYISRYLTMLKAGYGWETTLRQLNPTAAILDRKTNLAVMLQRCGWRVQAGTATHLLLAPAPGWTCPSEAGLS